MPSQSFDILVIGCGGIGSAALSHLARRGLRVAGIDQFSPPHRQGSSHGETRVIRKAYFEHPNYVPLLHRAYVLWDELAQRTARHRVPGQQELLVRCGLLLAGPAEGEVIAGARASSEQHQLDLQPLNAAECRQQFPMFRVPEGLDILFEADAGYLWVERCVRAHLVDAADAGAAMFPDTRVVDIQWTTDSVTVRTADGDSFVAASAVVTTGAWTGSMLARYAALVRIRRKTMFWFPAQQSQRPEARKSPVHLMDVPTIKTLHGLLSAGQFYGFPSVDGQTVKVAEHTGGSEHRDPCTIDREVAAAEGDRLARYARHCLTGVEATAVHSCVCYYSMSPDGHFLIDRLPDSPVVVAAGFSGHGFKFAPVMGEGVADLAQQGHTDLPMQFLSAARLPELSSW